VTDEATTLTTPQAREPRLLVWLPRVVMVLAAIATAAGLVLVDRLGDRYEVALELVEEAAGIAAEAVEPAAQLPDTLAEMTDGIADALRAVQDVAEVAGGTTATLAEALRTNVAQSIRGTADVATRAADIVENVERFIPGSSRSLAEELRDIADGLEPVPGQLEQVADQLDAGVSDLEDASGTLTELQVRLTDIGDQISEAAVAVQDLPALAARVQQEAAITRERAQGDIRALRIVVLMAGSSLVAIGWTLELLRRRLNERVIV